MRVHWNTGENVPGNMHAQTRPLHTVHAGCIGSIKSAFFGWEVPEENRDGVVVFAFPVLLLYVVRLSTIEGINIELYASRLFA